MLRSCAQYIFLATCLLATSARAQSALTLDWDAPAECPKAAWVEASVRRLLSTPPSDPLQVRAVVRPDGSEWVVDLRFEGAARGTRRLRAASCESVARAAALIVALALDPQAAALASEEMAQAEAPRSVPPVVPPPPPAPPSPPTRPVRSSPVAHATRARIHGHGFVAAALEHGYVPGVVPAAIVGGGVGARLWRADLLVQIAPFASGALEDRPRYGADFSVLAAELRGCVGPAWTWLALEGCAEFRGTHVTGHGTGLTESYRAHAALFALGAGVLVRIPSRTRLAAEASVDTSVPFTRPSFVLLEGDREQAIHRVPMLTARATLGVSLRF